jgi:hypothetical protein
MNTLQELYDSLNHSSINNLSNINALDYFKFKVAQNIIKTFLCYPSLESIYFDFGDIERISNVWEGSDEETIILSNRLWESRENIENSESFKNSKKTFEEYCYIFLRNNKDCYLPKFDNINDALIYDSQCIYKNNYNAQSNIKFIDPKKHYTEITNLFFFLTEEPSTISCLLKEHKDVGLDWTFEFNHKFNNIESSKNLEGKILKFLGSRNHALLMTISLNLSEKNDSIKRKNHKIKI